jgi:hypothetical protein
MSMFTYYKLQLLLLTEQLGTGTEASIYNKHVQEKAKKEIGEANRLAKKLSKNLEKYKGADFQEGKAIAELKGILRSYMERTGLKHELPDEVMALLEKAAEIKEEWEEAMGEDKGSAPTVFMRGEDGHPIISSHMILGNLKENLRIITNNGDKEIAKSKVAVGEMGALDIKVVEDFLRPSSDVVRNNDGTPFLLERPIKFDRMGKIETAISRSEVLPAGTQYACTLRIRTGSPLNNVDILSRLLDLGKNNGLGQWRGSGKKGTYAFKLEVIPGYKEQLPDGWN